MNIEKGRWNTVDQGDKKYMHSITYPNRNKEEGRYWRKKESVIE